MQVNSNSNNNNNNSSINKAAQIMEMQLLSQVLEKSFGDNTAFKSIMQTVIDSMANGDGTTNSILSGNGNLLDAGNSNGQVLESIPYYGAKEAPQVSNISVSDSSIENAVDNASEKYGVDKNFIKAVIKQESSFNPNSTSSAGAMGLMQLMPGTAKEMGVSNAYNVQQNVDGGTKYLSKLLNMYGNSKELALAAYNAGPGAVNSRGVSGTQDIYKMPAETRDYVQKVMKYYGK